MPDQRIAENPLPQGPLHPTCSETTVVSLTPLGPASGSGVETDKHLWLLDLTMPAWGRWKPGQFVMLRPASWGFDPLWARPFSICMAESGLLRIFFQDVGKGTAALARLVAGDKVIVWGPLGTSLAIRPQTPTLLLAGGMGLAPFIGYARAHPDLKNVRMVLGHRQDRACYPLDLLPKDLAKQVQQQRTEAELQAFVRYLEQIIAEYASINGLVLACGPHLFLRTVHGMVLNHGVKAQLSLENRMACGVGACLGCVTEAAQGLPVRVCNQGPVFWATDIKL